MDSSIEESLLTAQQVAEILAIKPSTVYDAVYRGVLPVVRLWEGRRRTLVRFRRTDIVEFIRQRAAVPAQHGVCEGRAR